MNGARENDFVFSWIFYFQIVYAKMSENKVLQVVESTVPMKIFESLTAEVNEHLEYSLTVKFVDYTICHLISLKET
jgi:hypothetical protein